jgi:hypothetical protein
LQRREEAKLAVARDFLSQMLGVHSSRSISG